MRLAIPISLVIAALLVGACDNSSAPSESAGTPGAASTEPSGGTETGTLVAFDARSGQELCRVEPPMRVVGGPIVAEGLVLVQGGTTCDFQKSIEGALVGYEAETGEERWRASAAGLCGGASAMSVSDGVAVVQDRETLRGLDVNTGEELWTAPFGLGTAELMRGSAGDIALVSDYGTWRAFDRQSGEQRWEMMAPIGTGTDPPPVVNATTAFFALYPSGTVAIDLATGAERWRASLGGETAGDRLVVSCTFDGSNMEDEAASKDKAPSTWVNTISAWTPTPARSCGTWVRRTLLAATGPS